MNQETIKELLEGGIDIEGIYQRLPGKDELIKKLLLKFPNEKSYSDLIEAMEAQDYHKAFESAHNLKGVAANMDMHPFLESVTSLVEKLRREEPADMEEELEAVKRDYTQVIETINKVLAV